MAKGKGGLGQENGNAVMRCTSPLQLLTEPLGGGTLLSRWKSRYKNLDTHPTLEPVLPSRSCTGIPMSTDPIPEPILRRLPRYYDALKHLHAAGQETVSTTVLAEAFPDVHPTQIRKDLAVTGIQGRPKVGFSITDLLAAIETFLHWNNQSEAFLVGAGSLATALLGDPGLWQTGIKVVAAFDNSPRKIGTEIRGIRVLSMDKFENLAKRMRIPIGILTVPGSVAQACADLMVRTGMRALWNLTPVNLVVPDGTIVEHVDLFASLAVLGRKLREQQ